MQIFDILKNNRMMKTGYTFLQIAILGVGILLLSNCNPDEEPPQPPVVTKPAYCNNYTPLSQQPSTATTLDVWCACEEEGFNLSTEIQRFTALRDIDFRCNNLEDLPTIPTLENLTINSTVELSDAIANNPSIIRLTLEGGGISTLPDNIDDMVNLKQLRVYCENFTTLPSSFESLPVLELAEFRSTSIFNVPDVFGGISTLKEIILTDTPLKEFPTELLRIQSIERITVDNCQLEAFPFGLDSLPNLKRLSIRNDPTLVSIENANNIQTIPARVGDLIGLEQLTVSNLNIDQMPADIANLSNSLLWLYMENCPVSDAAKNDLNNWLPDTEIYY